MNSTIINLSQFPRDKIKSRRKKKIKIDSGKLNYSSNEYDKYHLITALI